jgi:hypothetical protein
MNNVYVINPDNSAPIDDTVRLIDDMHAPGRIDYLLIRDVNASDGQTRKENRCHRRFQLNKIAFAMIRPISAEPLQISGMSMGSIGWSVYNSKPARLGKIDNISLGGLMFHHVGHKPQLSQTPVLDILLAECGFYLAGIKYKIITDVAIPGDGPGDPVETWRVRVQFEKLNREQLYKLKDFILTHGAENGSAGSRD